VAQEGKGERNKNLPIRSSDVAVRIKAHELHVQYDAHSSTLTKSTAVCHWAMPPLIERCCTNECSVRFSTFRSHLTRTRRNSSRLNRASLVSTGLAVTCLLLSNGSLTCDKLLFITHENHIMSAFIISTTENDYSTELNYEHETS